MFRTIVIAMTLCVVSTTGCRRQIEAQGVSGTKMATVGHVEMTPEGLTVEQKNIVDRIKADNEIGALKHMYVISAYSGQVILYSPVRGKVTSGGKRLTPKNIDGTARDENADKPIITVGGVKYVVSELPNEDGTYGSGSADYLYWFTPDGKFHQHFLSGGQIVHVSDTPLAVKGVVITVESK